jgi:hypothetical protein
MENIITREDGFIFKDRERRESEASIIFEIDVSQVAGIDICGEATEENFHAASDGRSVSEEPQDPVVLSGAESDKTENVQVIQRRYRKRHKANHQADVSEALLASSKLFKTIADIYASDYVANIYFEIY